MNLIANATILATSTEARPYMGIVAILTLVRVVVTAGGQRTARRRRKQQPLGGRPLLQQPTTLPAPRTLPPPSQY